MHQTLHMLLAADAVTHFVQEAIEENLHVDGAAKRSCHFEASCIKRCIWALNWC
jgi:hypothetical protein